MWSTSPIRSERIGLLRDGRVGRIAPGGVDPGLIGGVNLAVVADDADVEMVIGDDLGHLRRDGADGREEVELPRERARDAEELVQPGDWSGLRPSWSPPGAP